MDKRAGFIGLGVMGASMSRRLMDAGYSLYIYNRTRSKGDELVARGAIWCDSPEEVARSADLVFTIVGFPKDVEEVYLGEHGIEKGVRSTSILVDMTTTKPSLDIAIAERLASKGARMADAPVSGGDKGAREGTLSIMVGCSDDVFEEILPSLSVMGRNISHMGGIGSGQHAKMANQIVIAGTMAGVSEALVYGARAGLDVQKMVETISKGAAGCWTLDNLAPRVLRKDYEPGFMVDHFIKDMGIALEEAEKMELPLPSLALTRQLYLAIKAQGLGKKGTQVLVKAIGLLAGKEVL